MSFIYGNGISFDGATQYARNTGGGSVVTDNFSMITWARILAYGAGNSYIFHNGANDARGMAMFITNAGVFQGDLAFVANINSAYTLAKGLWYMLAWIRNAGVSQLYVNAAAQGSTVNNAPNTGGDYITLGGWTNSGGTTSGFANIHQDETRFYERAVSLAELRQLFNRALDPSTPDISSANLKYWYKLDESSGNPADSSGNGINLTNFGTSPYVQGIIPTSLLTRSSFPVNNLRPRVFAPGLAR